MKIAFIGIGNMGKPMALNLLKAGFDVTVYDIAPPPPDDFTELGGTVADTPKQAVSEAEAIITMLPSGAQVAETWREVLFPNLRDKAGRAGGRVRGRAGGRVLLIDCSTIDVATSKILHDEAEALNFLVLDAPVSGGVAGAQAGSLTFMCGGGYDAFQQGEQILQFMGKNIFHCGGGGMGQAAKICNNMMLGPQMIAVCEAFALAEKLGLAAEDLFKVSSVSSGQCWSLTSYCPWPGLVESAPSGNDYRAGFSAALMLKDLSLSQEAAASVDVETPFAAKAYEAYKDFVAEAGGDIDFSAIMKKLRQVD